MRIPKYMAFTSFAISSATDARRRACAALVSTCVITSGTWLDGQPKYRMTDRGGQRRAVLLTPINR